jgi:pimeloyl-ACP methyl ester carboxylesterase
MKLFFIHGAGGSHLNWLLITRELKNFEIINVDLPKANSIESYANYFKSYFNSNVIIIGHSMGGLVGYYFTTIFDNVQALILVNSAIFEKFDLNLNKDEICDKLYFSQRLIDDCKKKDYLMFKNLDVLKNHLEILNKFNPFNYLETFKRKKLLCFHIIGKNDKLIDIENLIKTSEILNCQNYFIEECGHMPHIEKPKEFLEILKNILININ